MKARCISNQTSALAPSQLGRSDPSDYAAPITIGHDYTVLGMSILNNALKYLIRDDTGDPFFASAGHFECATSALPEGWSFALRDGISAVGREVWSKPCSAVWGYDALVSDPSHAGALEEGEQGAFSIFFAQWQAAQQSDSDD